VTIATSKWLDEDSRKAKRGLKETPNFLKALKHGISLVRLVICTGHAKLAATERIRYGMVWYVVIPKTNEELTSSGAPG